MRNKGAAKSLFHVILPFFHIFLTVMVGAFSDGTPPILPDLSSQLHFLQLSNRASHPNPVYCYKAL